MRKRLYKKKYKQNWGVLWNTHDQIDYIQLNSRLFEHTRFTHSKFPHRKWAEARYNENKSKELWSWKKLSRYQK